MYFIVNLKKNYIEFKYTIKNNSYLDCPWIMGYNPKKLILKNKK